MAKMWISYEKRRGADGNPDKYQVFFACHDAYDKKDILKGMGFRFNGIGRTWEKRTTDRDFMTELAKVVVSCEMAYADVVNSFPFIPESILVNQPEESAFAAYNEYMDSHPEWF